MGCHKQSPGSSLSFSPYKGTSPKREDPVPFRSPKVLGRSMEIRGHVSRRCSGKPQSLTGLQNIPGIGYTPQALGL